MCGSGEGVIPPELAFIAAAILAVPTWWRLSRGSTGRYKAATLGACLYLLALLSLTFFPFPLPPYQVAPGAVCPFVYIVPFHTIGGAVRSIPSPEFALLLGNIAAFVPVGLLVPLLRPGSELRTALVAGFLVSLAVESGQLLVSLLVGFNYRQADVDDVIVNTVGAGVGYVLFAATRWVGRPLAPAPRLE